jgi:hypothetical protein
VPTDVPDRLGDLGEQAAARKYGLELIDGDTGFYDGKHRSNGRKVSVKSASWERDDGPGVYRFWRRHVLRLAEAGGSVVLVVVSRDAPERPVRKVRKVSPLDVLEVAEWRPTEQADMEGKQEARVNWTELMQR